MSFASARDAALLVAHDVPMRALNTFAFDVNARSLVVLERSDQIAALVTLCQQNQSWLILGGGSNLLLSGDIDRLVIHNRLTGMRAEPYHDGQILLEVAGGESWHHLVRRTVADGWWGLENLTLIPGSVGASPIQNIGAYGVELKDVFHSLDAVDLLTGQRRCFTAQDCQFAYRHSVFKQPGAQRWLILAVRLLVSSRCKPVLNYRDLAELIERERPQQLTSRWVSDKVAEIRRHKLPDPASLPNAGSFFQNPVVSAADFARLQAQFPALVGYPQTSGDVKLAAAWLIDQLGWKGRQINGAAVHRQQALVLLNLGGGPQAVLSLAQQIQQSVQACYGVSLVIEPVLV